MGLCGTFLVSAVSLSQNVRLSTKTVDCIGQSWSPGHDPVFETWDTDLSHGTEVFVEGIFEACKPRRREMENKTNRNASILEYLRFCAVRHFGVDLRMTMDKDLQFSYRSTGVSGSENAAENLWKQQGLKFKSITHDAHGYKLEIILPTSSPS